MIKVKNEKVEISGSAVEILSEMSTVLKAISEEEELCNAFITVGNITSKPASKEVRELAGIDEYEDKILSEVTQKIIDSVILLKAIKKEEE